MAPSAGKVTPKDAEFVAALESRFPSLPPRGALFQNLNHAKFDVSGQSHRTVFFRSSGVVVLHCVVQSLCQHVSFLLLPAF